MSYSDLNSRSVPLQPPDGTAASKEGGLRLRHCPKAHAHTQTLDDLLDEWRIDIG